MFQQQHQQDQQQDQMKRLRERDDDGDEYGDGHGYDGLVHRVIDNNFSSNNNNNKKIKLTVVEPTTATTTNSNSNSATTNSSSSTDASSSTSNNNNNSSNNNKRMNIRTEQYLEELERHENVQRTCKFFLDGLMTARANGDAASDASALLLLQQNLRRETSFHHQNFASRTQKELSQAQESIQLHDSMTRIIGRTMLAGDAGDDKDDNNDKKEDGRTSNKTGCSSTRSLLTRLNHGRDTSQALLDKISSYVGVVNDDDYHDCQQLVNVIISNQSGPSKSK